MAFYLASTWSPGDELVLDAQESRHCCKVMRHRQGDEIKILNGQGQLAGAEIVDANPKATLLRVVSSALFDRPQRRIRLVLAPPANKILSTIIRQAVEMGVSEIQLIEAEFSVSKPKGKEGQLQQEALAAMKQSENPYLLEIGPVISFSEAMNRCVGSSFYGAVPAENKTIDLAKTSLPDTGDFNIWIGPEGGFSASELAALNKAEVHPLCVSAHILRVETATIALVAKLQ